MQVDKGLYIHSSVIGLPKSLLEVEGGTVTVITLMQRKAGLNRDRKREIQSEPKVSSLADQGIATSVSKTDRNILTVFLSADRRWTSFWLSVKKIMRRESVGPKLYARAIDVQLLDAYDPEWRDFSFENDVLLESCAEWNRIREALERFWARQEKDQMPLGVFMLWPRLKLDLQRWPELDADQRTRASHAIFSLSSIGWTHWFIDESVSICPDLTHELGHLRSESRLRADSPAAADAHQSKMLDDEAGADCTVDELPLDISSMWATIGEELAQLHGEWQLAPSRMLLGRLIGLGSDAARLLDAVPDQEPPSSMLERRLDVLCGRLEEASSCGELPWLTREDLSSIIARWHMALTEVQEDDAVLLLADDAELAMERVVIAINEMRLAQAGVDSAKQALAAIDAELARPASAIRKFDLTNRQLQAKEELLGAERKYPDAMLFVLASASPRGEAYDPNLDYAAEMASRLSGGITLPNSHLSDVQDAADAEELIQSIEDSANAGRHDEADHTAETRTGEYESPDVPLANTTAQIDGCGRDKLPTDTEHTDKGPERQTEIVEVVDAVVSTAELARIDEAGGAASDIYFNNTAGEQCRPIWSLLKMGMPSLAYQFANALHVTSPNLRVAPPALLRSVALAPGLIAGDGPLAMSIGEAFGEIDQAWFEPGDAPSNWHTALNLLLIAATLRPMILAPAMGASVIASYRHLNGRYSALLRLVRLVGEVSEPLTGFAIGPTVLRSAADDASQKAQLAMLQKDAEDWLLERAPNKKIRYAPASKVWLHWLKPGEPIHKLISPVMRGATEERNAIRIAIEEFANYNAFQERVTDTDRRQLGRRGQDIEAGALEHLWVLTCEAVTLAKEWLGAESMLSDAGGRLRGLVRQLQGAFDAHAEQACAELNESWDGDQWGQVDAASRVLRTEIQAIVNMFRQSDTGPSAEIQAKELLTRDLLLVPGMFVSHEWGIEADGVQLLHSLEAWIASPSNAAEAFDAHVEAGDFAGALLLLKELSGEEDASVRKQSIDKYRDAWARDLQRKIQEARRASEVGLAYGYLSDGERAACEGELSAVELSQRDIDRFDQAMARVEAVASKIEQQKAHRIQDACDEFEREKSSLSEEVARQVAAPLARSDIHTFNELMQRVRQDMEPWPERDSRRDSFRRFFPVQQAELLSQLARLEASEVDKLIRTGGAVGPLSFYLEGDEPARVEAESVYRAWALSVAKRSMSRDNLRKILDALGFTAPLVDQVRGAWSLQVTPIVDREVCPVPHFGSRAQGRYRVVVLTDRLTPEDLLQRIGETSQQTATIVLVLSRSPARFWPELARISKDRQRSFLLLDESILLFLLAQRGSRLATWFDVALPFTYSEPYDASAGFVPPEMFYGRVAELEAVKAQGGCYFIYGGRQLGKTALLRRAEKTFHNPSADHYAVWIDLLAQGIGERRPAIDMWLSVYDKLRELNITGLDMPPVNPAKPTSIDAFLASIKRFLAMAPARRILLLLDEADHFFEQDARCGGTYAETRRLKQLMDETDRRFKVVFAGLHNVLRTASTSNQPLGHLNEAVRIGPLMDEREIRAAEELITRPIEAAGFEFDDRSLVMRVLAQTNYYPSLIQLYCTQLLRHLRETKLKRRDVAGPRFKIQETDIESVFSGRPLREAIRSKFRLTLQLDARYEVIAYAIGLEALTRGYDHVKGIDWRSIWQDCANSWWPEGFATTSERDFLALLEEMVQLGVLSQAKTAECFSLRNPNVLLLLGSKQEIENTLQAEREPRIEFKSTIFRPTLGGRVDNPARNPLTYRQLDEVVQMRSSVSLVAASEASGIDNLLPGLLDQPGMADSRLFIQLDGAADQKSFAQELGKEIKRRVTDGITVMLVPPSVPWNTEWVEAAQAKVKALTSPTSFVSVVFVADPHRLWALAATIGEQDEWFEPWLSVLPWARGFVRKWLEELQLPTDNVDRLEALTGFWGGLLESAARVKTLDFVNNLERMTKLLTDYEWRLNNRLRLTGGIEEAEAVLTTLQGLGDGVSENDIVEYGGLKSDVVKRALRWAEPLGLVVRQQGATWALDSFAKRMFGDAA
ncbi:hypothetical protein SAMN05216517_10958 [Janthinobacterium sp. OK676]|uniref:ATP-binding protein n=1 Tax=Janthinobacterium sp. OK676 TaxID=1855295 RepID=UPI000882865C|nr:ATP-binding protein [Janthinobacterium sp. OK676]SDN23105.1 hypothetical protein SAMN05216517_10958 [Janthinobacterium sp. OK676]